MLITLVFFNANYVNTNKTQIYLKAYLYILLIEIINDEF